MAHYPDDILALEERVDSAIAEWFEDLERGVCPGRREFLRRHAEISDELGDFLRDFAEFQGIAAGHPRPE